MRLRSHLSSGRSPGKKATLGQRSIRSLRDFARVIKTRLAKVKSSSKRSAAKAATVLPKVNFPRRWAKKRSGSKFEGHRGQSRASVGLPLAEKPARLFARHSDAQSASD